MESEDFSNYQYSRLIHDLLYDEERHFRIKGSQLTCCCPFHNERKPSFGINLETGLYNCFSCSAKGNIVQFVSNMKNISILQAIEQLQEEGYEIGNNNNEKGYYTLKDYAEEKHLDIDFLTKKLDMSSSPDGRSVKIPYFNEEGYQIGVRYRNSPKSSNRFFWGTDSKTSLYGLHLLKCFTTDVIVLVEGESDCHCAWSNNIAALGVPGAKNFKKSYAKYLEKFDKIIIHQEVDDGGTEFVKKICQCLPVEKLYVVSAFDIDYECKDLADLHVKGLLNEETLLSSMQKVPEIYLKEINKSTDDEIHVEIANKVLEQLYIKYYNENFYVYEDGVYKEGLSKIEQCIISIDKNKKKNIRAEILDYLRITQRIEISELDTNLINFKNGIYHLDTKTLEPHSPDIFTLCQVKANYLTDDEFEELKKNNNNQYIDKFMNDVCCSNTDRVATLLEYLGYSFTYSVKLQKCLVLLGETADNGKSTYNELILHLFSEDNYCSISISEFSQRFFGAELNGKLLNVVHEVEDVQLRDLAKFKTVISGNGLTVEEKYKNRYKIKPFTHHIFAMNNLPELKNGGDSGFFRRLQIVPFQAKFSDEEKENFDFNKLITQESLNYLANTALRKYQKMLKNNNRKFSNHKESEELVMEYQFADNSALIYLSNASLYANLIDNNNKVKIKELYDAYENWCIFEHLSLSSRKAFANIVKGGCEWFKKAKMKNGYECVEYVGPQPVMPTTNNHHSNNNNSINLHSYYSKPSGNGPFSCKYSVF